MSQLASFPPHILCRAVLMLNTKDVISLSNACKISGALRLRTLRLGLIDWVGDEQKGKEVDPQK